MYYNVYNVWRYDKLGEIVSNQWTKDEINNIQKHMFIFWTYHQNYISTELILIC